MCFQIEHSITAKGFGYVLTNFGVSLYMHARVMSVSNLWYRYYVTLDFGACILQENVLIQTSTYHLKAHRKSQKWYEDYLHRAKGKRCGNWKCSQPFFSGASWF